jgi:hypothetical protein
MTQAINLANFSNSLDSSGGVPPTQLNAVVPISKGGTNASTASVARTNLGSTTVGDAVFIAASTTAAQTAIGTVIGTNVPSPTGTGASGTWAINVTGNATTATTATNVSGIVALANGGTGQTTATLAGSALGAIGVGQTWQNVASSRATGTTYTNSTGRPILVAISGPRPTNAGMQLTVNGITVSWTGWYSLAGGQVLGCVSAIVPAGGTYSVTGWSQDINPTWVELR